MGTFLLSSMVDVHHGRHHVLKFLKYLNQQLRKNCPLSGSLRLYDTDYDTQLFTPDFRACASEKSGIVNYLDSVQECTGLLSLSLTLSL